MMLDANMWDALQPALTTPDYEDAGFAGGCHISAMPVLPTQKGNTKTPQERRDRLILQARLCLCRLSLT